MGEGVLGPHAGYHTDGFLPLGLSLLGIDLEAPHLDEGGGPARPKVHAAVAHDVQDRRPLGHPYGVVVVTGKQGDGVAYADPLGALGDGPVEDLGRRAVGELLEEMVLHGPEVVEANVVGQLYLGHDLLVTCSMPG